MPDDYGRLTMRDRRELAKMRLAIAADGGGDIPAAIRSARYVQLPWRKIAAMLDCTIEEAKEWENTTPYQRP